MMNKAADYCPGGLDSIPAWAKWGMYVIEYKGHTGTLLSVPVPGPGMVPSKPEWQLQVKSCSVLYWNMPSVHTIFGEF